MKVNKNLIARIWKEADLKPYRLERYMASTDPLFEQKAARERTEIHCKLTDVVCEQIETGADLGEVALDPIFFFSAEWRIRQDDIHTISGPVTDVGSSQCVVMPDEARILDAEPRQPPSYR